ncbi:unnamed protein product [marine sediment metagenome]|uniref:Uncharacterized protein n=1 Tax=marine sediment metagenome TaxID=412755 RepID=X0Z0X9_9ZZZZ
MSHYHCLICGKTIKKGFFTILPRKACEACMKKYDAEIGEAANILWRMKE